jgi:ribosomal-protein-alanine N-acetyltransferase
MEKVPVSIRKFRIEDIHNVLEVEKNSAPKSIYAEETFLYFARVLPDTFFVLETEKAIIGYIIFDNFGHIYSIVVDPVYRKMGLGTRLMMHALTRVKEQVWLEVRTRNTAAISFYTRLGMHVKGRIPGYYEDDDALVMVLSP